MKKRLEILSRCWVMAAFVGAGLVLPPVLGAQGPAQGIKVHGHWVIEVRNADGMLQQHREFENSLTASGARILTTILTRAQAVGLWGIVAIGTSGLCTAGVPACFVEEPTSTVDPAFKNLTVTYAGTLTAPEMILRGSFVALSDGQITSVGTNHHIPAGGDFTRATLGSAVSVQATQTVSVTVTLTFS